MRQLDRKKPFVEVFGDVDVNEKDSDGKPHVPHRYRQYGMMFDGEGKLIGKELPVPPDEEDEEAMRTRIERELRVKIRRELQEEAADRAKKGGSDDGGTKADGDSKKNGGEGGDLPGNLGKDEPSAGAKKK